MKVRDPLVQTLLSIFVPFYIIYWSYVTAKDIEKAYGHKAPNILLLLAPAIIFLIGFGMFFATIAAGSAGSEEGAVFGGVAFLFLLLIAVPLSLVLSLVYYYLYGGNVEKVAGPQASRVLIFILFWFVAPAGVYIVQEKLNALSGGQTPQTNWHYQPQPEPKDPPTPSA